MSMKLGVSSETATFTVQTKLHGEAKVVDTSARSLPTVQATPIRP